MPRLIRILLIVLLFPPLLSVIAGWTGVPGFLHPQKREFTADMVRDADVTFAQIGAMRRDFSVPGPGGAVLRGWKVYAAKPNGNWILVFHGVADNRYGVTEHARLLLQAGYDVVMMDSRAHGAFLSFQRIDYRGNILSFTSGACFCTGCFDGSRHRAAGGGFRSTN